MRFQDSSTLSLTHVWISPNSYKIRKNLCLWRVKIAALLQRPPAPENDEKIRKTEALLNKYTTERFDIDCIYPDDFKGAQVFSRTRRSEELQWWAPRNRDPCAHPDDCMDGTKRVPSRRSGMHVRSRRRRVETSHRDSGNRIAPNCSARSRVPSQPHRYPRVGERSCDRTWQLVKSYGMTDWITDVRPLVTYAELAHWRTRRMKSSTRRPERYSRSSLKRVQSVPFLSVDSSSLKLSPRQRLRSTWMCPYSTRMRLAFVSQSVCQFRYDAESHDVSKRRTELRGPRLVRLLVRRSPCHVSEVDN